MKPAAAAEPHIRLASNAVPLPRPKPGQAPVDAIADLIANVAGTSKPAAPQAASKPAAPSVTDLSFKLALSRLDSGDLAAARTIAAALPDRSYAELVDWLAATTGGPAHSFESIRAAAARVKDWPAQSLIRLRLEQAFLRAKPSSREIVATLNTLGPLSTDGTIALARAYLDVGRKADAATLMRPLWRERTLSAETETSLLSTFGSMFTGADHRARMARMLFDGETNAALRASKKLGKNDQLLAEAFVAVNRRAKDAAKKLGAVPAALRSDPIYLFAEVQHLRRQDKYAEAAKVLMKAPRDAKALIDPADWSSERRMIARELTDRGDAKTAYRVVAGHSADTGNEWAEAEFQAGWLALRFLGDAKTAQRHFSELKAKSSLPLTQSRADYWLGRAAEAARDNEAARRHYASARAYSTTFYGLLAAARLGDKRIELTAPPQPNAAIQRHFENRTLVRAIRHLFAVQRTDQIDALFRALADTLEDPAEITLLARLAEANGRHQTALQVGKWAQNRGLAVDSVAFPTAAIDAFGAPAGIDAPIVYAIARQESAFNATVVSRAGALGLLQLMPATAQEVAKAQGLPYSKARLTSDPAYNVRLGAAYLNGLLERFNGSYIMTFAAYNAGASRVNRWVEAYGDPRDPKVDAIDWIERIPFSETRNYVQRTIENLQVYRARLGRADLTIEADINRGARR